jgi:hypothetical protein
VVVDEPEAEAEMGLVVAVVAGLKFGLRRERYYRSHWASPVECQRGKTQMDQDVMYVWDRGDVSS